MCAKSDLCIVLYMIQQNTTELNFIDTKIGNYLVTIALIKTADRKYFYKY